LEKQPETRNTEPETKKMLQNGKAGNGKTFTERLNSSEFKV
jgi:hypothetical protein